MNAAPQPRPLTPREKAVVARILDGYSGPGAVEFRRQFQSNVTVCGPVTMLEIRVADGSPRAPVPDGPLGIRAIVEADESEPLGEISVWIRNGSLSGLEYAWYSSQPPDSFPDVTQIRLQEQ